ncbi:hypothetical protein D3C85_1100290 [compost metagenome]
MCSPVGTLAGLGILLVGPIDEVDLGFVELRLGHHCVVMPERVPADGEVNQWRIDERHGDLAIDLDDFQSIDFVGAAPQGQVHVGNLAAVVTHVRQSLVEVIAHDVGQGNVQGNQQQTEAGEGPQGPAVSTFHGGKSLAV